MYGNTSPWCLVTMVWRRRMTRTYPRQSSPQLEEIFAGLQEGDLGTGCDPVTGAKLEPEAQQQESDG